MGVNSDMLRGFRVMMILYRLSLSDSYGYEISKFIRDQTDNVYTIKETTLYSTFNRLEKQGEIRSLLKEETRDRKRTYFKLTDSLKNYLENNWYKKTQVNFAHLCFYLFKINYDIQKNENSLSELRKDFQVLMGWIKKESFFNLIN